MLTCKDFHVRQSLECLSELDESWAEKCQDINDLQGYVD